jgi:chromosome segregation ATPase
MQKHLEQKVAETAGAVDLWKKNQVRIEAAISDANDRLAKAAAHRKASALDASLGNPKATAELAQARAEHAAAQGDLADLGNALNDAVAKLAEAEVAARSARAALARFQAEIEMRRRIGLAARVDAAIAALADALKEFDAAGSEITSLDALPHGMMGSSAISRTEEIAGNRRIRAALPKSFLRYFPGSLHEERPAQSLEASETAVWSLPAEPTAKAA